MSARIELVSFVLKTSVGRSLKAIVLRRGGKVLFERVQRLARQGLVRRVGAQISQSWMIGAIMERALGLYPKYLAKYPFLSRFPPERFAETVAEVMPLNQRSLRVLMGLIIERYIPEMAQMRRLLRESRTLATKAGKQWSEPVLVSGCRTLEKKGKELEVKELGDWLIVSRHEDGRVWVMAIIESKSLHSVDGLIPGAGEGQVGAGQHLWDIARFRSEGFRYAETVGSTLVEYRVPSAKVVVEHMPPVAQRKPGGYYTRLVAVAPRPLKASELKRLGAAGVDLEHWDWPIEPRELLPMVDQIYADLIPLVDLPP